MDGLNDARLVRVAELATDVRNLQGHLRMLKQTPIPPTQQAAAGYQLLSQCNVDAQPIVAIDTMKLSGGRTTDTEEEKTRLRRLILDVSVLRHRAAKIHMLSAAAYRWVNRRGQLLRGREPTEANTAALAQIDATLRQEVQAVTDAMVFTNNRQRDIAAGLHVNEDPTLKQITAEIQLTT